MKIWSWIILWAASMGAMGCESELPFDCGTPPVGYEDLDEGMTYFHVSLHLKSEILSLAGPYRVELSVENFDQPEYRGRWFFGTLEIDSDGTTHTLCGPNPNYTSGCDGAQAYQIDISKSGNQTTFRLPRFQLGDVGVFRLDNIKAVLRDSRKHTNGVVTKNICSYEVKDETLNLRIDTELEFDFDHHSPRNWTDTFLTTQI